MKALITGATGFLGKHLVEELKNNYEVFRLSRSKDCDIVCDISKKAPTLGMYDLVVHAAGKAHSTPKTEVEKEMFFKVNSLGTQNLLKSLEKNLPSVFVLISTVAVYGLDRGEYIDESFPLLGGSAYADSKIEAEKEVLSWCKDKGVKSVIFRLPLISGINPPGNLSAMSQAIKKGYYFRIGKAEAKRSMVAASDIGKLIAKGELKEGVYNLTDGMHPSIADTEEHLATLFGKKIKSIPLGFIKWMAKIGDAIPVSPINSNRLEKLSNTLTFSDERARVELGWKPKPALSFLHFHE